MKCEDNESQPSKPVLRLTVEKRGEHSSVTFSSSNTVMKKLNASKQERYEHSCQNSSPKFSSENPSDEIYNGPLDTILGKEIPGESTEMSTTRPYKMMIEVENKAPRESVTTKRFHKTTSLKNKKR